MFETPLNLKTVSLKLKRIEVCDLLLACTALSDATDNAKKWSDLHDKLQEILNEFDKKQGY
jgi:hypothetical protein